MIVFVYVAARCYFVFLLRTEVVIVTVAAVAVVVVVMVIQVVVESHSRQIPTESLQLTGLACGRRSCRRKPFESLFPLEIEPNY